MDAKMIDTIKNISAIIVLVGMFFGGYTYIDSKYAQKGEVEAQTKQTVTILEKFKTDMNKDRLEQNYINIINVERQYKVLIVQHPTDKNLKQELKEIQIEKNEIKEKLDKIRELK